MLSKIVVTLSRRFANTINLRLSRNLQSDQGSYLHNPGSEPLNHSTLGDVIAQTAHKYPGRIAIRSIHEDVTITYEELLNQADSLGCALRANGFKKGDRLGIWAHNCSEWIVAVLGAARVGVISVFINPVYEKNELSVSLKKTQSKGLIIGDTIKNRYYYGLLNKILPELQSSKDGALKSEAFPFLTSIISIGKEKLNGIFTLDSLISNYKNNADASEYCKEVKEKDGSIILLTSGSTGEPKAALVSHLGVVNNIHFSGIRNLFNEEHQIVCLQAPLFHSLGSIVTTLSALRHGCTVVISAPTYNVSANINALCAEKCTVITGTPTMYVDILSQIKGKDLPIKLRSAHVGGSPGSPQLIRQINAKMKTDFVGAMYGLTEITGMAFQSLPGDTVDVVADTVGYITDHTEAKIVGEDGKIVPFGTPGELILRGYNNMICYWDEPEMTKKTVREDGWLHTGDKFTLSPEGYGTIVGRLKDIIVRGGENITPKEIEDVLNMHQDVIDCQVVGLADERLGEELCAVVRVREGATFNLNNMTNHCSGKLARYKIPRILKTIDEFPRTGSGKIQKFKIKEMIESGKL